MRVVQRYRIYDELASGGMATVSVGRLAAEGGFSKIVAVKTMHPNFAKAAEFRAMFLDEATMVANIRHPNVVSTLDVIAEDLDLFLVMEYVHGPSVSALLAHLEPRGRTLPVAVALSLAIDLLEGLHAAHEARSKSGEPLRIVHRDVSPHNMLVGEDGTARVMDFGIATAADRLYTTRTGEVKGKVAYMAPEQARGEKVDRRADVYAAGSVLFELLTMRTPFGEGSFHEVMFRLLLEPAPLVESFRDDVPAEVSAIVARALAKDEAERFDTALDMAEALRLAAPRASHAEVAELVTREMPEFFQGRAEIIARAAHDLPKSSVAPPPAARTVRMDLSTDVRFSVPSPVEAPRPRRRRTAAFAISSAAALVALIGLGVATRTTLGSNETMAAPSATTLSASPNPSGEPAGSVSPITSTPPPTPLASSAVSAASSPGATTRATGSGVPRTARSVAAVAATASGPAPSPAATVKCCIQIGGVWQRYSLRADCVNNCPPDMR